MFKVTVRAPSVSNSMWIGFFVFAAIHGLFEATRYIVTVDSQDTSNGSYYADAALFIIQVCPILILRYRVEISSVSCSHSFKCNAVLRPVSPKHPPQSMFAGHVVDYYADVS